MAPAFIAGTLPLRRTHWRLPASTSRSLPLPLARVAAGRASRGGAAAVVVPTMVMLQRPSPPPSPPLPPSTGPLPLSPPSPRHAPNRRAAATRLPGAAAAAAAAAAVMLLALVSPGVALASGATAAAAPPTPPVSLFVDRSAEVPSAGAGGTTASTATSAAAVAADVTAVVTDTEEAHESVGARAAAFLTSRGVPPEAVVFLLSAAPVIELRGGIPTGLLLGLPPTTVFPLAVAGNVAPILPMLALLRLRWVNRVLRPALDAARAKTAGLQPGGLGVGLALFVGVPLPGTGVWTGVMGAHVLGMAPGVAAGALGGGVLMAAVVVMAVCQAGWVGGGIALLAFGSGGIATAIKARRAAPAVDADAAAGTEADGLAEGRSSREDV